MKALARNLFIRNDAAPASAPSTSKAIQNLTCNLLPKLVRNDSMEGRDFLVVPMVILTEGVHRGSGGPLYYPKEELSKTPEVWNHKPVVVYHPEINGQGVSACDPTILTNRKVGLMMNTKFEKGRLRSEAWLEKDRVNAIDERIMAAVENNEMMELSTGVFVDQEAESGEWKGEEYSGIARNYRPDHLALLPDKIGACSIADGAGFLRNEERRGNPLVGMFKKFLAQLGLQDNELSHSNISNALSTLLRKKLNMADPKYDGPFAWICDTYSDFFIYEVGGKLYRLSYSAADTGVTLGDEKPVEVQRVTEYRTVEGAKFVGNQDQNIPEGTMNKKTLVDAIILAAASLAGSWSEPDRETLMAMNEDQLKLISNKVGKAATPPPAAPAPATPPNVVPLPATNTQTPEPKKPATLQEYVAAAPPEVQQVLNHSMSVYNEEKQKLVEAILAVKNHSFTKEDLSNRPLGELRNLAALAQANQPQTRTAATPNYSGQAPVPQTTNEAEECLTMPVLNFSSTPTPAVTAK